jgi:uncharacterized protein YaaR (DUF327 family)
MSSPTAIAKWMYSQLEEYDTLYQDEIAEEIQDRFGEEFVSEDARGNLAIKKNVLKEFAALIEDTAVWDKKERMWRMRDE